MREKELSTKVIFVRHGETDFPLDRIYCDHKEDPALNQLGLQQAEQAAKYLSEEKIDAIYVSPCLRTRMTAEAILRYHSELEAQYESALMERCFGVWEGLYFAEIENQYPEEYLAWKKDQAGFKPEGGESVYDMAARTKPVLDSIIGNHAGKVVVVVAHVGPIRGLVAEAVEMPIKEYRRLRIDPASITQVNYGKAQNNLILLNFHARHWRGKCA